MTFKHKIKGLMLTIIVLLAIQTITYHTLGPRQLEKELLTEPIGSLTHFSDSAFVRDFYVSDCGNVLGVYESHNLKDKKEILMKQLRVKYIQFQDRNEFSWNNKPEKQYRLVYNTWSAHDDFWTLYGLFSTAQTEELIIDWDHLYRREVHYRWVLFFWTKSFEFFESHDKI